MELKSLEIAEQFIVEVTPFLAKPTGFYDGSWKIGYGTILYPDGSLVREWGDPIPEICGRSYLKIDLRERIYPVLEEDIITWDLLNDYQRAALLSLGHNLGPHFSKCDLFEPLNNALKYRQTLENVPDALVIFCNPGTPEEDELLIRRKKEAELWNTP